MDVVSIDEVLDNASRDGMIDLDGLQQKIMARREEILKQYASAKWQGPDGIWYVNLPDATTKRGRRQIQRTTEADLDTAIIAACTQRNRKITFERAWHLWREVQDVDVCDNTIYRYNGDWKRFFEGTDFAKKDIRKLQEKDVKLFIIRQTKTLRLCKKATKTLFGYISRVIFNARRERLMTENPVEFLHAHDFYRHCTQKDVNPRDKIVSSAEMSELSNQIQTDYIKKTHYIAPYAVEFASYTGMRVGEVAALKWSDIHDGRIRLNRFERFNELKKYYQIIDRTKNSLIREIPVTAEMQDVLNRTKAAEMRYGYVSEWVFSDATGRIHTNIINSCLKNKCKQVGINAKGIHAFRRTLNSEMKTSGTSTATAAAILGHSEAVNKKYYDYDMATEDERRNALESASKRLHNA